MKTKVTVIKASDSAKRKFRQVAEELKGQELFKSKIESARRALKDVKSLPI